MQAQATVRALWSMAFNTLREALRSKVFGSIVFVAVLTLVSSLVLGEMSLHREARTTRVVTHYASSLFAMLITVYASITLLHTEMERRTVYTILSKPIPRWLFIVGKFSGVQFLVWVVLCVFAALTFVLYAYQSIPWHPSVPWSFVGIWGQTIILTALALFFASFSSPLLAGFATCSVFVGGNFFSQLDMVQKLLAENDSVLAPMVELVRVVLPNMEALNLSYEVTYSMLIPTSYGIQALIYVVSYTCVVLSLAIVIFGRRDFS